MIKHILIADDDPTILSLFDQFFKGEGYSTELADDGLDALFKMKDKAPDLLITDIVMDPMDGLALIREAKEIYPDMPVIAISGGRSVMSLNFQTQAEKDGADEFVEKPIQLAILLDSVKRLLAEKLAAE